MVEYAELKLMNANPIPDEWSGMDEQIAQLEFENSLLADQSMFSSIGLDVALISTDSLDIDTLRQRCETNKNDYKIAFEDSGQWTTSGFGTGASPSGNGTAGLEEFSSDDIKSLDADSDEHLNGNMTTWGRIKCVEPFDAHTKSMPSADVRIRTPFSKETKTRPASLVANFMDRQSSNYTDTTSDVDVNENKVSYGCASTSNSIDSDSQWKPHHRSSLYSPQQTVRVDKEGNSKLDLNFLKLPFQLPSFCRHSAGLDQLFKETTNSQSKGLPSMNRVDQLKSQLTSDFASMTFVRPSTSSPQLTSTLPEPDSGYSQSRSSGPLHIEDWASLSMLLPKHVVDTCCFFKSNVNLLTGDSNLCIDKKLVLIKSTQSDAFPRARKASKSAFKNPISSSTSTFKQNRHVKLNAAELANIGLPSYDLKRHLVEKAVEGVAGILRGEADKTLFRGLEQLLKDGLSSSYSVWDVVVAVTTPGKATCELYDLVQDLCTQKKSSNAMLTEFFSELLKGQSLDGWLSYVVLKERILCCMYEEDAFIRRATTAYRSLLWRLIESLELLSVLSRCQQKSMMESPSQFYDASRLPSDSRVPKSSSVPARLCNKSEYRRVYKSISPVRISPSTYLLENVLNRPPSKIPLCKPPSSLLTTKSLTLRSRSLLARASEDVERNSSLTLQKGESVRVLSVEGQLAQCKRLEPKSGLSCSGTVPTKYLKI